MSDAKNSANTLLRSKETAETLVSHQSISPDVQLEAAIMQANKHPERAAELAGSLGIGVLATGASVPERNTADGRSEAEIATLAVELQRDNGFRSELKIFLENIVEARTEDADPNEAATFYAALFAARMYKAGSRDNGADGKPLDLIAAVLSGADARPGDDSPEHELQIKPGSVDASLARANDHLSDALWRQRTREALCSELAASMRLARHLGDVTFMLRQPESTLDEMRAALLDLLTLTYYGGFLAGTDAAEASYLASLRVARYGQSLPEGVR